MDDGNCNSSNGGHCGGCSTERGHCGCGAAGKMIMLSTEDGQEIQCVIISEFRVDDIGYIALRQVHNNDMLIFRYAEGDDGTIKMDNIKSDEEFDRVSETFKNQFR